MTTTQLSLYNDALSSLGERELASLSENREPRRVLDRAWDGAINACLELADWKFAQRTSKLIYEPSYTPTFGYARQFSKPSDWVRWSRVCLDERLQVPLLNYDFEAGFLFTDQDEIYVSYVSNDASYGGDFTLWPKSFETVVSLYLATQIVKRIAQAQDQEADANTRLKQALRTAKSTDALQGPTKFLPPGQWAASRGGHGGNSFADRGSRSQLIG